MDKKGGTPFFGFTYMMGVGIHLGSEKQHDDLFLCSCQLVLCMSNPNKACCPVTSQHGQECD